MSNVIISNVIISNVIISNVAHIKCRHYKYKKYVWARGSLRSIYKEAYGRPPVCIPSDKVIFPVYSIPDNRHNYVNQA